MRTLRRKAAVLMVLSLTLQGCMATAPDHAFCNRHAAPATSVVATTAGAPTVLNRSVITPPSPLQQANLVVPSVIHASHIAGVNQPGVAGFLLNNVTQLLLVCAVSGKC